MSASVVRPSTHQLRPRRSLGRWWPQWLAIGPYYLLFLVFGAAPVVFSMGLAFTYWDGLSPIRFAGFDQFRFLLEDALFRKAVVNTFIIWVMNTVPMLVVALCLAALVHQVTKFKVVYQAILFLPSITSIVAIVVFFKALFDQGYGLVNQVIVGMGGSPVAWFETNWGIKFVLATLMTWQWVGYNAIIYSAGLSSVPNDLYEAARIDGATGWRAFRHITVPVLRPIILFTVVMSTITGLQSFTESQVMFESNAGTNANAGGPGNAGLTMVLDFYREAFNNNNYGYGAALAWAIFVIVGIFTVINWRLFGRKGSA